MDKIKKVILENLQSVSKIENLNYAPTPLLFNVDDENFEKNFLKFIKTTPINFINDLYDEQLKELFFLKNPQYKEGHKESTKPLQTFLEKNQDSSHGYSYRGSWIYYPWRKTLMHLLPEDLYYDVRTYRNRYLVTPQEQKKLYQTTIGIAGLSVGNSVALTLAYSGIARSMKLADPDIFSLSNLNRVRVPLYYLGVKKVFVAAEQIYEINPYAQLTLYSEGINEKNIKDFLIGAPRLNLVIDEMDHLKMKLFIRLAARAVSLPVVMATDNGDNGIIDVDRFDISPHEGPFGQLPQMELDTVIKGIEFGEDLNLTMTDKIRLSSKIVGPEGVAPRMQDSLLEVGKSIASWPQLGISAFLGGVNAAYVSKGILLGWPITSGKKHVSLDESFLNGYNDKVLKKERELKTKEFVKYIQNLENKDIPEIWKVSEKSFPVKASLQEQLTFFVRYAILAPSTHNTQPWKFFINSQQIIIKPDSKRALPVSDPHQRETYISLGAALENILIAGSHFNFDMNVSYEKDKKKNSLIKITCIKKSLNQRKSNLLSEITRRFTDRSLFEKKPLNEKIIKSILGLNNEPELSLEIIVDQKKREILGEMLGNAALKKMSNKFFRQELSYWIRHNFTQLSDGFGIGLPDVQSLIAPFLMHEFNLERGSKKSREQTMVENSSAVIIIRTKFDNPESWIKAGQLYERVALHLSKNELRLSIHAAPIEEPEARKKLIQKSKVCQYPQVFLRIGYGSGPIKYSPRRDIEEVISKEHQF